MTGLRQGNGVLVGGRWADRCMGGRGNPHGGGPVSQDHIVAAGSVALRRCQTTHNQERNHHSHRRWHEPSLAVSDHLLSFVPPSTAGLQSASGYRAVCIKDKVPDGYQAYPVASDVATEKSFRSRKFDNEQLTRTQRAFEKRFLTPPLGPAHRRGRSVARLSAVPQLRGGAFGRRVARTSTWERRNHLQAKLLAQGRRAHIR